MGYIPFITGTSATVVSAANTSVESANALAVQILIGSDELKAMTATFQTFDFFRVSKNTFGVNLVARGSGQYRLDGGDGNFGYSQTADLNLADLPAATDLTIFFKRFVSTNGLRVKILGPTGTVYADTGTGNSPGGALSTGSGTGVITLKNANTVPSGNIALRVKGLAIYNTEITGAAEYQVPTTGSSGLIALYRFGDGTDDKGGASMTPTNVSFNAATDSWDPVLSTSTPAFGRYGVRGPVR